jgi:hypothetical protein
MDELEAVREMFARPEPPRLHVTSSARARLRDPAPPRARTWLRVAVPATAVAAAVSVAAAVAVQSPQPGAGDHQTARSILLAAARTVAGAPAPAIGRYWKTTNEVTNFVTVGQPGGHYLIAEKSADQEWTNRAGHTFHGWQTFEFTQALSAQPASPQDRAAWQRDGSPTTWNTDPEDTLADPHGLSTGPGDKITAGRGKPKGMGAINTRNDKPFFLGRAELSARELQALPTSPTRLRALILGKITAGANPYLFGVIPGLLTLPVTPAVRAALYRLLAGLPGVQGLGQVTDPAGQQGAAVAITSQLQHCGAHQHGAGRFSGYLFSSCTVQQRLIIDTHTGLPLAQELSYLKLPAGQAWSAPDGLFSYQLFQSARWTNDTPPEFP